MFLALLGVPEYLVRARVLLKQIMGDGFPVHIFVVSELAMTYPTSFERMADYSESHF